MIPNAAPLSPEVWEKTKHLGDEKLLVTAALGILMGAEQTGDAEFPTERIGDIALLIADVIDQLGFHRCKKGNDDA